MIAIDSIMQKLTDDSPAIKAWPLYCPSWSHLVTLLPLISAMSRGKLKFPQIVTTMLITNPI